MNKKSISLISMAFGFICLLLTAFENAYGILAATLLESSILAGGTWILLDKLKNKEGRTPVILIVSSIIAGALSIPIVLFIMDWILQNPNSGLHWGNWMICSGSVILMGCCYKERRLSVYILSLIIYWIMNLCVHPLWIYGTKNQFDHSFISAIKD